MTDKHIELDFNTIADIHDNSRSICTPTKRLVVNEKIKPGHRVLDVACGTGWAGGGDKKVIDVKNTFWLSEIAEKVPLSSVTKCEY